LNLPRQDLVLIFIHLIFMPLRDQLADAIRQSIDFSLLGLSMSVFVVLLPIFITISTRIRLFSWAFWTSISSISLIRCRSSRDIYILSFLWVNNCNRSSSSSFAASWVSSFNLARNEN